MNFGNLNELSTTSTTSTASASVSALPEGFDPSYFAYGKNEDGSLNKDVTVDVLSRMHYPARATAAIAPEQKVIDGIDENLLNDLISATGLENNKARKTRRIAARVFYGWMNKETQPIGRGVKLSIVRNSRIFDIEDGMPVLVPMLDFLVKYGFMDKKPSAKTSGETEVFVPMVADMNRWMTTEKGNISGKTAFSFFADGRWDSEEKTSIRFDCRTMQAWYKSDDFDAAVDEVLNGTTSTARRGTVNAVKTAVLLAYSMIEDLDIAQGRKEGRVQGDIFRKFGVRMSDVYYGRGEFSKSDSAFVGWHGILTNVFDLALLGGNYENVSDSRFTAGEDYNLPLVSR